MATKLTEHFTLEELTYSATAAKNNIPNIPTELHKQHLKELAVELLEPLRMAWGGGIRVSSGYRGFRLNQAVKGSKSSAHCNGYAADLVPVDGRIREFKKFTKEWLKATKRGYDQFIDERKPNGSEWVHLGLRNSRGGQRRQNLKTLDGVNYTITQ